MAAYRLGPVIGKIGGAEVEEIPVAMSGTGINQSFPLATVDAGDGALVLVAGDSSTAPSGQWSSTLVIGSRETELDGAGHYGGGGHSTGAVDIRIISGHNSATTDFAGNVFVIR